MTAKLSSVYLHLVQIVPSFFPFSRLPRPEASGAELVCCAVQRFKKTKVCTTAAFKIKTFPQSQFAFYQLSSATLQGQGQTCDLI